MKNKKTALAGNNIIHLRQREAVCYLDIWMARMPLDKTRHVQGGSRPVLVVSSTLANLASPVITVIPLTSKFKHMEKFTHVSLHGHGLRFPSVALVDQVTTIDKRDLLFRIGSLPPEDAAAAAIRQSIISYMGLAA